MRNEFCGMYRARFTSPSATFHRQAISHGTEQHSTVVVDQLNGSEFARRGSKSRGIEGWLSRGAFADLSTTLEFGFAHGQNHLGDDNVVLLVVRCMRPEKESLLRRPTVQYLFVLLHTTLHKRTSRCALTGNHSTERLGHSRAWETTRSATGRLSSEGGRREGTVEVGRIFLPDFVFFVDNTLFSLENEVVVFFPHGSNTSCRSDLNDANDRITSTFALKWTETDSSRRHIRTRLSCR